ncbi:hypothetical protein [Paracoccus broussonetiae]|nr:hypothetical protein [Paracoccus sp. CPCC 101403]
MMLLLWPVVAGVLFSRMDRQRAVVWTLLAGYLLLPTGVAIDLPAVPGITKHMIPAMCAALFLFLQRDKFKDAPMPPHWGKFVTFLLILNFTSPMLTTVTNSDPLPGGVQYRPALSISQGISETMLVYIQLLPFFLGYRVLWDRQGAEILVRALVLGILAYSVLMLFEVRFSPQLNIMLYGYFQHDFGQTIRYGGFRPIVFLEHPLWVAVLTMCAFVSAIVVARNDRTRRNLLIACYLAFILLICRSAGALLQAMMAAPLVALGRPRTMVVAAAVVASLAFAYPVLRTSSLVPLNGIVDAAMSLSPERGRSLEFRLSNEEKLVERALERPLFGWGGWGRSLFLDPFNGRLTAIPDGLWVIWMGAKGVYGYLAQFLMLILPIWTMLRAVPRRIGAGAQAEYRLLGCLALILAMNCLDLIPNATLTPVTWLMAGTLMGNARRLLAGVHEPADGPVASQILPKKAGLQTVL